MRFKGDGSIHGLLGYSGSARRFKLIRAYARKGYQAIRSHDSGETTTSGGGEGSDSHEDNEGGDDVVTLDSSLCSSLYRVHGTALTSKWQQNPKRPEYPGQVLR